MRLMILAKNSAETVQNTKHTRSLFGGIPVDSAPLPDQSQTLGHDCSSCGGKARTSGRGMNPWRRE